MDNYEQQIYAIKEAQANKLVNDLNAKKEESLTALGQQEQQIGKQAVASKQTANISSQVSKLNFAEFMAKRGQTNAGIAQAAELSRQNVLARDIGNIETNQAQSLNTIEQDRQAVNRDYNSNLASGKASIEADIATKLLNYREQLRQEQVAREEQLRKEEVAREEQLRKEELAKEEQLRKEEVARKKSRASGGSGSSGGYPLLDETAPISNNYASIYSQALKATSQDNAISLLENALNSGAITNDQAVNIAKVVKTNLTAKNLIKTINPFKSKINPFKSNMKGTSKGKVTLK